jgi:hypothetical protein
VKFNKLSLPKYNDETAIEQTFSTQKGKTRQKNKTTGITGPMEVQNPIW